MRSGQQRAQQIDRAEFDEDPVGEGAAARAFHDQPADDVQERRDAAVEEVLRVSPEPLHGDGQRAAGHRQRTPTAAQRFLDAEQNRRGPGHGGEETPMPLEHSQHLLRAEGVADHRDGGPLPAQPQTPAPEVRERAGAEEIQQDAQVDPPPHGHDGAEPMEGIEHGGLERGDEGHAEEFVRVPEREVPLAHLVEAENAPSVELAARVAGGAAKDASAGLQQGMRKEEKQEEQERAEDHQVPAVERVVRLFEQRFFHR